MNVKWDTLIKRIKCWWYGHEWKFQETWYLVIWKGDYVHREMKWENWCQKCGKKFNANH